MTVIKKTNPHMPKQELKRGPYSPHGFVEGEDFTVECPPWADPLEPGAFPSTMGYYLVVSRFSGQEIATPELDIVWLGKDGGTFYVHEFGDMGKTSERSDYWWVGKIHMPELKNLRPD